ncbi:MAG TPA: acyltransferase [Caulobacter sp.]|nr:acyltransferase [Caulobacter sp.]
MQVNTRHIPELQSLRGLAACVVMVHHALRTIDGANASFWISEKILNAHAAVVIFFVLSGYVLTLSLHTKKMTPKTVGSFWIRRAFRIYPALIVASLLGLIYFFLLSSFIIAGQSAWMNENYLPSSFSTFHVALSFMGVNGFLLPQSWTITVELVVSILLPVMVLIMARGRAWGIATIAALAALSIMFGAGVKQVPLYLVCFAIGAAPALYPEFRAVKLNTAVIALAALALLFFRHLAPWQYHDPLPSLVEAVASAVLIVRISNQPPTFMRARPLTLVGDWSYSIYLFHLPIAFALAKITLLSPLRNAPDAAATAVALTTTAITVAVSAVTYNLVELPPIRISKEIVKWYANAVGRPAQSAA